MDEAGALGDAERALAIYRLLLPYHDRVAICYPEICTGPIARYLGLTRRRWGAWTTRSGTSPMRPR